MAKSSQVHDDFYLERIMHELRITRTYSPEPGEPFVLYYFDDEHINTGCCSEGIEDEIIGFRAALDHLGIAYDVIEDDFDADEVLLSDDEFDYDEEF